MREQMSAWAKRLSTARGRSALAAAVGITAMLLILLSELWPGSGAKNLAAEAGPDTTAYQAQLEQRLAKLIAQVEGAGKTTVMITLETGEERIYALDTQSGQTQSQQTHVLLKNGTALEQTVCLPRICGVAVVCEGGGDVRVAARITEMVSALMDLPTNRICVEQRTQ